MYLLYITSVGKFLCFIFKIYIILLVNITYCVQSQSSLLLLFVFSSSEHKVLKVSYCDHFVSVLHPGRIVVNNFFKHSRIGM